MVLVFLLISWKNSMFAVIGYTGIHEVFLDEAVTESVNEIDWETTDRSLFFAVHCGSMRQTATIIHMDKEHLRTGDKAMVRFRFIKQPEFVKPETRMIFREGRTKAVGTIQRIDPTAHPPPLVGGKVKHRGPGRGTGQSRDKGKEGTSGQTSTERTGKK